ncbi:MAG: hypothetical protein ACOH2M_26690 [Cypionkella sp.]
MPNPIAYLMLFVWPMISWQFWRRMEPGRALIWTVLGGYLIMPPLTAFNLPILPDLDKTTIPNLVALYCAIYLVKDKISYLPRFWVGKALIMLYVMAPLATVLANPDPLIFVLNRVEGMKFTETVSAVLTQVFALIPFLLARKYLSDEVGAKAILLALITAGLIYSVPMLIESRLSPQINVWVYGFFQHDFFQTIRQGGYRPVVFLPHGLWVAFFALMALMAAVIRFPAVAAEDRPKAALLVGYLLLMLFICKSAGPMIYAVLLTPLIWFAPYRVQVLVAAGLAAIVVSYPILRSAHLVPLDQILSFARGFSADRAYSLQFRIENEELLLARAQERPWFGWGGFGRAFLHDPITGEMTTIADGAWVILLGTSGWLGYISEFGLTALPLLALGREALARHGAEIGRYSAGLGLILAANMVDLLPNATHIPFTWLMAGALLGRAEQMQATRRATQSREGRAGLLGGSKKRTVI